MPKRIVTVILFIAFISMAAYAQSENSRWQSLDGPYWCRGIDVAIGTKITGDRDWCTSSETF